METRQDRQERTLSQTRGLSIATSLKGVSLAVGVAAIFTYKLWIMLLALSIAAWTLVVPRARKVGVALTAGLLVAAAIVGVRSQSTAHTTEQLLMDFRDELARDLAEVNRHLATLASSPSPPPLSALEATRQAIVSWTNGLRAYAKLPSLAASRNLNAVAQQHSERMVERGALFHPSNREFMDNVSRELSSWTRAGENLGSGPDWESILRAFRSSEGHASNMLFRGYDTVGVGLATDGHRNVYVTLLFVEAGRAVGTG